MNKDDILQKYKDSKPKDEGIEYIDNKANKFASIGFFTVIMIIMIYNAINGIRNMGFISVFFAYSGMESYGRYKASKDSMYIYGAVFGVFASIVYLANYIVDTI